MTSPVARRRPLLFAALLALALLALLWLLARPTRDVEPPPHASPHGPAPSAPAELLDASLPTSPEPARVLVDLAPRPLAPALPLDAGPDPFALPRGTIARRHVHLDLCDEPVPAPRAPPETLATIVHEGITVAFDAETVPRPLALALAREAAAALDEAAAWLASPRRETLLVVTYPSQEAMAEALGEPAWATGIYDGAVHVVAPDYALALRHEVLHAQLHVAAPCVPFWLGEGLAARFEREPGRRAFSWLRMLHARTWIPFASLAEPLAEDEGAEEMSDDEVALLYAQSLAMVSLVEARGGPDAIPRAVRLSREGTPRAALFDALTEEADGPTLLDHLAARLFPALPREERPRLRGARYWCAVAEEGYPDCELARR